MKPIVTLHVMPDGMITCLHSDAVPLNELGRVSMKRASTVEFNPASQKWEVVMEGESRVRFRHASRGTCLEWERTFVDKRINQQQKGTA
jgi:hypothetical protein